ncbi:MULTISPECIES: hypothetical protein [Pseudomonas]|uniref:Uncharacterized protein n=1 Tax=Pseudomonas orientalis TaxID=76758 RepID=A0A4Q7CVZ0_9PSED|nr:MULTISPECIES: hypothetical protein [Pseudomonas]POM11754.1 hypothetical protein CUU62_06710 [Pseudomonas sp. WP001]MBY8928283.1 hypothetical protein [Pseudomonas sp. Wu6]RZI30093.1 hypothetical protein EUX57_19260 [Pseudomonas orientalis]CRM37908.1 hypothetical protein [Pseudomonas sp. 24 E 13]CRM49153.1 hypothetical protein [Pseudomonas sp. 44 R 15]
MSKTWKTNTVKKGSKKRSLDYEPNIGDEIYYDDIGGNPALEKVVRKIYDETIGEIVIYLEPSQNPYP